MSTIPATISPVPPPSEQHRLDADGAGGDAPPGESEDHQPPTAATSTRHTPSSPRTTYCSRSIRKRSAAPVFSDSGSRSVMVRVAETSTTTTVLSLPGGRATILAVGVVAGRGRPGCDVHQ